MNVFTSLHEKNNDPLYDWKQSMKRSRSISCLDKKVDIVTAVLLVEEIIYRILKESTPSIVKDWTWIDPCAGRGTFGYVIFITLFDYLKDEIPDEYMRKEHILNRIYLAEINKGLANNLKRDFANVFNVNSLEYTRQLN